MLQNAGESGWCYRVPGMKTGTHHQFGIVYNLAFDLSHY